jgi:chromosome segregation ATPase
MAIAFGVLAPLGKIFNLAPRSSAWGYWQIGALSAALVGVISTIGLAILKQAGAILGVITTIVALAAAYAFRKIYEVEAKDHAAADIKKAVDDQKQVNIDQEKALLQLRAQNDELQKSLQIRNDRVQELEKSEGQLKQDLAKAEVDIKKFEAEQVKEAAASAQLKEQMVKLNGQLQPFLGEMAKEPLGPRLAETAKEIDGEEDKINHDVAQLKAVVEKLTQLYQETLEDNQKLRLVLQQLPKEEDDLGETVGQLGLVVDGAASAADKLRKEEVDDAAINEHLAHLLEQAKAALND